MELFDSHCHYNDEKFDVDRDNLIKENIEKGITKSVVAGYSIKSSEKAVQIAEKYPNNLYAIVGISPNDIEEIDYDKIKKLALNKNVVGIGEIGLDFYWNKENKNLQKQVFINQINIANELNLPIIIHSREAVMDTLEILKTNNVNKKGIFHCCPLNIELIKEAIKLGYYISFSGNITFKNSKNAYDCVKYVPLEKILIETDSPYMTPEPYRGKRNNPSLVYYVAKKVAEIKEVSLEEIAKITYNNTKNIFEIK